MSYKRGNDMSGRPGDHDSRDDLRERVAQACYADDESRAIDAQDAYARPRWDKLPTARKEPWLRMADVAIGVILGATHAETEEPAQTLSGLARQEARKGAVRPRPVGIQREPDDDDGKVIKLTFSRDDM